MRTKLVASFVALAVFALGATSASANISKAVQKKFAGKIVVTEDGALSTVYDSDSEMIKAYKKANLKTIKGTANEEGTKSWTFFVMAFMKKKPGKSQISLDFYRLDGKKKVFVADKRLSGIDPSLPLLATRIDISEDDGLDAGKTYLVKLTVKRGKKEITLAETKLTAK